MKPLKQAVVYLLRALAWAFAPVELVRAVGPGKRPLRRHEWNRRDDYR